MCFGCLKEMSIFSFFVSMTMFTGLTVCGPRYRSTMSMPRILHTSGWPKLPSEHRKTGFPSRMKLPFSTLMSSRGLYSPSREGSFPSHGATSSMVMGQGFSGPSSAHAVRKLPARTAMPNARRAARAVCLRFKGISPSCGSIPVSRPDRAGQGGVGNVAAISPSPRRRSCQGSTTDPRSQPTCPYP